MSRTSKTYGGLLSAALVAGLTFAPAVVAQQCDSCGKVQCPPSYNYHYEGAPKVLFKRACPRPICDPCNLPHYGYFQTCWHPWPFPPDWSHCAVPPPGALVPHDISPPRMERVTRELPDGEKPGDPLARVPRRPSEAPSDTPPVPAAGPSEKLAPAEKHPADPWVPPPSLPPPSLPALGSEATQQKRSDAAPARLPDAPSVPPSPPEPRLTPTAEPPKTESDSPMSMRNDGTLSKPASAIAQTSAVSPASPVESGPPADAGAPARAGRPRQVSTGPGGNNVRMVNSRRIMLDYDLAKVTKPDLTVLEPWFTQDGRTWEKDNTSFKSGSPYIVEVNREGTYGFMLVARRAGEKYEPPAPGEQPQVWVEVDWTKPVVHIVQVRPAGDPGTRQLSVAWIATDNNLAAEPITLSWAEGPDGPWQAFATQIENIGRYTWQVPGNVPARVYLRIEALDLAGNVGAATTLTPVIIPGGGR